MAEGVCCSLRAELFEGGLTGIGGHIDTEALGTVDLLRETLGGSLGTALGVFSLEAGGGSTRGWFLSQLGSSLDAKDCMVLGVEQEDREGRGWSLIFELSLHWQRLDPRSGGREKSSHHPACSGEGLRQAIRPHTESCLGTPRRVLILSKTGKKTGMREKRQRSDRPTTPNCALQEGWEEAEGRWPVLHTWCLLLSLVLGLHSPLLAPPHPLPLLLFLCPKYCSLVGSWSQV